MAKALKVVGQIAGVVAAVLAPIAPPIAAIAAAVSAVATIGAQVLYKPPPARGSVTQVVIAADPPSPYVMGEGYFAGVLRHDVGYGATLKKVPNPYRWLVSVYTHGGPIHSISPRVDLLTVGSWYSGFLYTDTQLGACPESTALAPNFSGAPGWGSSAKLSGQAAIGWNLKFDKDGKVFASGVPRLGGYGKWVLAYDPRKDSTFPGGSGSHRLGTEATYEWTANPALHAGTYAHGRIQNGKRVMGIGMPVEGVDWVGVAGWANVCDANGWSIFGVVYEPGSRWENLKEIAAAGGCVPVFSNGRIGWHYHAPKVALDTITDADIADENYSVTAMASWRDRTNSIIPKCRSEAHDWEMVAGAAVTIDDYVTDDGELKQVEWPFNLVKDADQAAQLAAYKLLDSRELQPIVLPCLPRLRHYRPGECLHIDLPELGLDIDAVILTREFDPARMVVTLTLIGETPEKHDYALGRTGTPPPTPSLKQTAEERDRLRWAVELDRGVVTVSDTLPSAEASVGGDLAMTSDGRYWKRVEDNVLSIGGVPVEIGGVPVTITWTENDIQPVTDGFDAIAALAADAQATADGKVQTFYQASPPGAHNFGDLWFDTDDGNKLYRSDGATFIVAQDGEIGLAITAAAGAQATADGKVTTFYGESTPTPEGVGDLWYKPSTRALTRWTLSDWEAVAALGVEDNADVTSAITGPADVVIDYDFLGTTPVGSLPRGFGGYKLIRNGVDRTADATWTATVVTGTIDADAPAPGVFSVDAVSGDLTSGTILLEAELDGIVRPLLVTLTKETASAPVGGGGSSGATQTTSSFAAFQGTSQVSAMAAPTYLEVTAGAGGKVDLSAPLSYTAAFTTNGNYDCKLQWQEWNGSSWVNLGSEVSQSVQATWVNSTGESTPGSITCNYQKTGLTPGASFRARLVGRTSNQTARDRYLIGTASAVGS